MHPQYSRHREDSAGWAAAANGARRVVSDMPKGTWEIYGGCRGDIGRYRGDIWRAASRERHAEGYLYACWGAGPQPWHGHWRAGGWL